MSTLKSSAPAISSQQPRMKLPTIFFIFLVLMPMLAFGLDVELSAEEVKKALEIAKDFVSRTSDKIE